MSCARRTRMSFARLRASIRWSRERSGACAWVLRAATAGDTNKLGGSVNPPYLRRYAGIPDSTLDQVEGGARLRARLQRRRQDWRCPAASSAVSSERMRLAARVGEHREPVRRRSRRLQDSSACRRTRTPPIPTMGGPVRAAAVHWPVARAGRGCPSSEWAASRPGGTRSSSSQPARTTSQWAPRCSPTPAPRAAFAPSSSAELGGSGHRQS